MVLTYFVRFHKIVQTILGIMGIQTPEFTACRGTALSVRLSEGFLVLMAVCSVRSIVFK